MGAVNVQSVGSGGEPDALIVEMEYTASVPIAATDGPWGYCDGGYLPNASGVGIEMPIPEGYTLVAAYYAAVHNAQGKTGRLQGGSAYTWLSVQTTTYAPYKTTLRGRYSIGVMTGATSGFQTDCTFVIRIVCAKMPKGNFKDYYVQFNQSDSIDFT